MSKKRTDRTKEFKFKVALEAAKGQKQIAELAEAYIVHPDEIYLYGYDDMEEARERISLWRNIIL